jgi:tRNA(Leu) C34 or U34 (ribose-2'-O)-methylase TrmL
MKSWRDNIFFILIEPKEPGNIGASARAMKDMGFKNLELVKPVRYLTEEARSMACDAIDVLDQAAVYPGYAKSNRGKKFGYWDHKAAWKTKRIDHSSEGESEKNSKESVSALLSYGHPEMSRVKSAP